MMTPEERAKTLLGNLQNYLIAPSYLRRRSESYALAEQRILEAISAAVAEAVAAEREACLMVLSEKRKSIQKTYHGIGTWNMIQAILTQIEFAIRTRGEAEDESDA